MSEIKKRKKKLKTLLYGNKSRYRHHAGEKLSVEARVECLIDLATDPNICMRRYENVLGVPLFFEKCNEVLTRF